MDQVRKLDCATAWRLAAAAGLLVWLAGCDPSPASRALKAPAPGTLAANPAPEPATAPADQADAAANPASAPPPRPDLVSAKPAAATAAPEPEPVAALGAAADPASADMNEASEPEPSEPELESELDPATPQAGTLELLGQSVPARRSVRLTWAASEVFEGVSTATPVLVVNGREAGPIVCLTAAIHGDELNGIEMVRRIMHELDPDRLTGAVVGVPIVNLQGFRRGSRYLPDRRDLNRYFPGNPQGSSASRIAYSFFESIIRNCDVLVDLHTGSFYRTNMPQLRADLRNRGVRDRDRGLRWHGRATQRARPGHAATRGNRRGHPHSDPRGGRAIASAVRQGL